jgi:hypothetical protein
VAGAKPVDRQAGLVGAGGGSRGAWVDAARWLAWWEAARWARSSWEVQNAAGWQLAKVGRWMMRDADDHR